MKNLWKSFFASTVAFLIFKTLSVWNSTVLFSADASYFYSGGQSVGINHEIIFFIILGILCGMIGSAYIEFQRNINIIKKKLAQYNIAGENLIYTFSMCFLLTTIIFYS